MNTGDRVGDYEIIGELGLGGMGCVYRVRNVVSDRVEAMKILLPDLVGRQNLADRFLREIRLLATLSHPNIASLRTAHIVDNQFVMIMELVEGQSIASRLERGPIAAADALNYVDQVLAALAYAHEHQVVHRDIKPANMMLTAAGVVKLTDFGIARTPDDQTLTMTGTTTGSLAYMSPEQVKGTGIDARSDIYSLGISLYEMVTGRRPFIDESGFGLMKAHLEEAPKPPIALQPQLPQVVNDLILTAIAKDPAQRFPTAAAFRAAIDDACRALRVPRAVTTASVRTETLLDTAVPAGLLGRPPAAAPLQPASPSRGPLMSDHARTLVDTPSSPLLQTPRTGAAMNVAVPAVRRLHPAIYMAAGALLIIGVAVTLSYTGRTAVAAPRAGEAAVPPPPAPTVTTLPATQPAPTVESVPPPVDPRRVTMVAPNAATPSYGPTAVTPPIQPVRKPVVAENHDLHAKDAGRGAASTRGVATAPAAPAPAPVAVAPGRAAPRVAAEAPAAPVTAPVTEKQSAELDKLEDEIDQLSVKADAVNASLDRLQEAQARQGLGLRRDMLTHRQSLNLNLTKAHEAFTQRNAARARHYVDLAHSDLEALEEFLGR